MNAPKSTMSGLKRSLPIVFNRVTVSLLVICLVTTGCALIILKKETAQGLASTALVGRISTAFPGKGPIINLAIK